MNVLVLGLGLNGGGVGSAKFFAKKGEDVRVTDLKTKAVLKPSLGQLENYPVEYTLGEHKKQDIDWADLIIKNPGVKPGNTYIEYAQKLGKRIEQDMGIFLDHIKPSQIIGITGTKGKSTTASLIYEVLKNSNRKIVFAGNIGKSVLDLVDQITSETLVILELSSFQLESFETHKISPKWAVITNIYPDHLNYYNNMKEYIAAKKVIAKYQTPNDYLFISNKNADFSQGVKSQIIFYSPSDLPEDFKPLLEGVHNKSDMATALAVAKTFAVKQDQALRIMANFKGIPFRMELIKEWHGIKIYNDTTATSPDAAIQAIKTFPNSILICGGMNKGMNYREFAKTVDKNVKKIFFLEGDSTEEIKNLLENTDKIAGTYNDLKKLLTDVKKILHPGDTVLFSPAATSFNLFQNEFDRGRKFNLAVQKVFV